ncbi:hypothetical protein [Chengkuizengella marina]|uniref:Uncharacterized protein n=1 Tax=Chengkuizengella marina TaxID=2507566 RepID=A0A6N9Q0J8_9BACL|nr:hypothetical protein [Chengkuizengella marina]NBI28652.1 hypothetical protein [Chengkuizengella marina]
MKELYYSNKKKFRGKRRYFRNLWNKVETYELDIEDNWFDFYHIHLDFSGHGNNSKKIRNEHIKAHLSLYKNILKQLEKYENSFQSWICIHEEDTGADAVYVHTKNPNYDDFPFQNENINWECKIPNSLMNLIDIEKFNVGYISSNHENTYFIQSKEHGVSINIK